MCQFAHMIAAYPFPVKRRKKYKYVLRSIHPPLLEMSLLASGNCDLRR